MNTFWISNEDGRFHLYNEQGKPVAGFRIKIEEKDCIAYLFTLNINYELGHNYSNPVLC